MDDTDRKLLALLQEDATRPIAELAAAVNLSTTPCWRRIQKLEAAGVIKARVALLDPVALGFTLTAFVEVETADHSTDWLARFSAWVESLPEAMEIYRMAGDVDYLIRVEVADMAAYDRFYQRLIAQVPLKNVTSRFAMERIKQTTAYALDTVSPRA